VRLIRDPMFWITIILYALYLDASRYALGG
jgi:hypothetical protein